ncbi:MAG: hypothetical protein ABIO02_03935, partial [Patescibacteria group bacterium]
VISLASGWEDSIPSNRQSFADILPNSTFWLYIERLKMHNIIGGYTCGLPGEPCDSQNRAYFRPNSTLTKGQISKMISIGIIGPACPHI